MDLGPLRQRDFALLFFAGLISLTGNWVLGIALPVAVLGLTGSPAAVATVVAASLLGTIAAGTVAGVYVDRWDRRRVVVVVNVLQVFALLPLLLVDDADRVWIVVAVAFTSQALAQFFQPAENALLPRLVDADRLPAANALNTLNNNLARLVGPALGGVIAVTSGLAGAALVDAGTFAIAAVLCGLIRGSHRAVQETGSEPERHLLRELAEGLRAVGRNRIVRAIFVIIAVSSVGEGMMGTLFAVYVTKALHAGGRELGWLMSAQAVGGIIGSLAATRVTARFRPVPLIATCWTFFGVVDVVIFNYPRWDGAFWPVLALFVIVGLPVGIHLGAIWTLFQIETPDRLRGRAFSAIWMGASIASVIGAAVAGALGDKVDVITLLTVQGVGCIVAGLTFRWLAGPGPASLVRAEARPVPEPAPAASA
ncbi:putative MFS family arabinose efflux permease [Asanoa ferruginea]|uniref:Putative MFS family arabinose efflux permease n=1 Tax=Asanoa ferruginea TaxID=53367 RepID=A0A3D9ZB81_9ACTN|nr:MFS transporter [Asanoa ferruginea]REF94555.1 putative MFS family arabinose efflux permease [Asanoa ferruginea]GIF51559.1 MFS transporter [Asanoa ferruginea]